MARAPNRINVRGHVRKAQADTGLAMVVGDTARVWRKHGLGYDQTKDVVERVRRELALGPPPGRRRSVERRDRLEVERLIQTAHRTRRRRGLVITPLFPTGARVSEFVQARVEDLRLAGAPPRIHPAHGQAGASRYVPILPSLAQERRTHLQARRRGHRFESNRRAGVPAPAAHSIASILLDSGRVPIDQVQTFPGHLRLSTTQIDADTSGRALGTNYLRALSAPG